MRDHMNKTILTILTCVAVFIISCNGGSTSSTQHKPTPSPTFSPTPIPEIESNHVSIVVGEGNTNNLPSITVTVCQPYTTICQTFDKILLDTGSIGLKINKSLFSGVNLPSINQIGTGLPIAQCNLYGSGYLFATANYADVYIGGEKASNIPIQIIDDGDQASVPTSCSSQGAYVDFHVLGMNGIIGVNPMVYLSNSDSYTNYTYVCSNGNCSEINSGIPVTYLNVNPVSKFSRDNNGEKISLPSVDPYSESPVYGTLTFGLNTKSNNQLPANVNSLRGDPSNPIGMFLGVSADYPFTTLYDTGTNYLYFYTDQIQPCTNGAFYFYCPDSTAIWNSYVFSYDAIGDYFLLEFPIGPIEPIIDNYYPVLPQFGTYAPAGYGLYGLPFFLGKDVYIGFTGYTTSMGDGPTWGFVNES